MHEFAVQLDMKEGVTQSQQEEVEQEEDSYKNLMRILTELRETKNSKVYEFKSLRKENVSEEELTNKEIE